MLVPRVPNLRSQAIVAITVGMTILLIATTSNFVAAARHALTVPRCDYHYQTHKSDEEMIHSFQVHRRQFSLLVSMILRDKGLLRVDTDWTVPRDPDSIGVSQDQIGEYRRIMRNLGISRGFWADPARKDIKFISTAEGYVTHGSSKGYVYTKIRPEELDPDLDEVIKKGEFYGYRHIEGDWYLFYEKD
jgi:hypothetical protein